MERRVNQFEPDYCVTPGEILEETLEAKSIKKNEFAERSGLSAKTISQIISGSAPLTPDTAILFERVLGISATVWNNLEGNYRLKKAQASARETLGEDLEWAKSFPLKELIKRGVMEEGRSDEEKVENLFYFFGVASREGFDKWFGKQEAAYRSSPSFEKAPYSVASWLRTGELIAAEVDTNPFDKNAFSLSLKKIRSMTLSPPSLFVPEMKALCRLAGVALVLVSELPKTHLSGAARWMGKDKAVIMLSLRYKTNDHFWFTFFHEAGHVLLHSKKKFYIDDKTIDTTSEEELEANDFAADLLIPRDKYTAFIKKGDFSRGSIGKFAAKEGIAEGIVVGRLQHDKKISFQWHNGLKQKFILKGS